MCTLHQVVMSNVNGIVFNGKFLTVAGASGAVQQTWRIFRNLRRPFSKGHAVRPAHIFFGGGGLNSPAGVPIPSDVPGYLRVNFGDCGCSLVT